MSEEYQVIVEVTYIDTQFVMAESKAEAIFKAEEYARMSCLMEVVRLESEIMEN
jgi:hypothetical protein